MASSIVVALVSAVAGVRGEDVIIKAGELFSASDPAVKKFPHFFGPQEVRTSGTIEQATAAPGEKRRAPARIARRVSKAITPKGKAMTIDTPKGKAMTTDAFEPKDNIPEPKVEPAPQPQPQTTPVPEPKTDSDSAKEDTGINKDK